MNFDFGMTNEALLNAESVFSDQLFKGKRVLITGGGSGIGKAIAWLFAKLGASVIISGRNEEKLKNVCDSLKEAGYASTFQVLDIREPDNIKHSLDKLFENNTNIDILINNAGGQFPQHSIDFSPNGWKSVIHNNLNGTWFMMQAMAKQWKERALSGVITNTVVVTDDSMHGVAHTCAARAGIICASQKASVEWAEYGIRVNCIAPGLTDSEGLRVYPEESRQEFEKANPMKKSCSVWDIAQAFAYVSSDAAKFMTGETIHLDGGSRHWGEVWMYPKNEYWK